LVHTKLFIPRLRSGVVPRSRLSQRLNDGAEAKLIVVSAPAGFGKTTSLVAWLDQLPEDTSVAWLSLDESDQQPSSFWTYVVTALRPVAPAAAAEVLSLLQSAQPSIENVLAPVLNELNALPHDLYLVLDDYHLVDGAGVAAGMVFLLEHLPPHVHVVLSTRADPGLPLARFRARRDLVEIRATDLRFTPAEVSRYLGQASGLELTEHHIAMLEARTEGWIAALQLAALSLRGRQDVTSFINGFAGNDRYIVDYLVEEVLSRQPEDVRTFLLQTSVLDRLTGDLCDAVTGQRNGTAMLDALDRGNLFVVRLDDSRQWYRYHHLFADVLQVRLHDEHRDQLPELHRRASQWYDTVGEPARAVSHALAGGDVNRAAALMELAMPGLRRDREDRTIRGWVDLVPDPVVHVRPVLALGFVGALMSGGEFEEARVQLHDLDRRLHPATAAGRSTPQPPPGMVVVDQTGWARLPGVVELYWTALALVDGDSSGTHRHAQLAIDSTDVADHVTRAGAAALSGLAYWGDGDLESAHRAYSTCVDGLQRAGHVSDVLGCTITLGDLRVTQGRLTDALATYRHALALAAHEPSVVRGTPDMHVAISQIHLERDELELAAQHVQRSQQLGEHLGLPQNPYRWRRALALLRAAEGDMESALELLGKAQRVYTGDFSPNVRPIPALRARLLASHGDVDQAAAWAREHDLAADDALSYVREYEHITLARVLIAQYAQQGTEAALLGAAALLRRLLAAAMAGNRTGNVIEILVLLALTQHAGGHPTRALPPLHRAVTLAEPEDYVRVFTTEGTPVASLLHRLAAQQPAWSYPRQLLDACAGPPEPPRTTPAGSGGPAATQSLVDPLSERELEVLRLLASELNGPDLARHLVVSVNTLRTHTRNIYTKLGVNSRRAAVRRAIELKLLTGDRHH
jgi:LuxR family maltose regulon positive regulatory protein